MDLTDPMNLARFPFLGRAKEYVAGLDMTFDDMLAHPVYSSILSRGQERLLACFEDGFEPRFQDEKEARLVILSYPVARMMAATLGSQVIKKHARGESEAAALQLAALDSRALAEISSELAVRSSGGKMPFADYVRLAAQLARKSQRWKLVNRELRNGMVTVSNEDLPHLLKQAIADRVAKPIEMAKIPQAIIDRANSLKTVLNQGAIISSVDELDTDALPPCMKAMISAMEMGHASHQSMFMLATFLSNLGLTEQQILGVYSKSPKFDAEKASYQLKYITGEVRGTEYICPACPTIKSQGLCIAQCEVKHPLQYYRRRAKKVNKKKKK